MATPDLDRRGGVAPESEHPGCVLGISLGLCLLVALVYQVASFRARDIEPGALLADVFQSSDLPFGLVAEKAATLPGGDRALVLGVDLEARASWTRAAGCPAPSELALVLYADPQDVSHLFRARGVQDPSEVARWESDPSFDLVAFTDAGELSWSEWRAVWFRDRRYSAGGTWRDRVTVNLSRPGRWCVLRATWPVGEGVQLEALERLLESWELRSS